MQSEIQNLNTLMQHHLGSNRIVKQSINRLTAAGDNYGSTMLAVDLEVQSTNNTLDQLHIVAKIPPPSEFMQKMFNTPVTFKNEIYFYKTLVPHLQKFVKSEGVAENLFHCFPAYIGSRLNNNESEVVDENATLLLENLKLLGFDVAARTEGFDYGASKLILKSLAELHAVPLALKIKRPQQFQEVVMSIMKPYNLFTDDELDSKTDEYIQKNLSTIRQAKISEDYLARISNRFYSAKQPFFKDPKNSGAFFKEPFATVIHTDAWVNNFMVKIKDGKAVESKIVDFQMYEYGSPARDVIFFLFTSIQDDLIKKEIDNLIQFYFDCFINILKMFKCDTTPFTFMKFQEEIKSVLVNFETAHIFMMLDPIFAEKKDIKELADLSMDDLMTEHEISEKCKQRICTIAEVLDKKQWM